jgi:hypothetical protein
VALTVKRDLVPCGGDFSSQRAMPVDPLADEEERRMHADVSEQLEHSRRSPRMGTVVERQCSAVSAVAQPPFDVQRDGEWREAVRRCRQEPRKGDGRAHAAIVAAFSILCLLSAGCGGSKDRPATTTTAAAASARDRWGTVWLCRPSMSDNPCLSSLATTVVGPTGSMRVVRATPAANPPVDCFYVYPTVSGQSTVNANLAVDFREREVAIAQAAQFSQACNVYAPVYRQITLSALDHPKRITLANALLAYRSVLSAFRIYLAHYNNGRGIVFIGHSQGAAILIRLIQREVDPVPALRHRLVSALLLGGNVTVAKGRTLGGDFNHIPACTSSRETGCVVAYSSFTTKPRINSQFGRTTSDAGVALLTPRKLSPKLRIMCVNPASPSGGTARIEPSLPSLVLAFLPGKRASSVTTPWVAFPNRYTARCESSGNASWLQISPIRRGGGFLARLQDPVLGLHVLDVNIALDDLLRLVRKEETAYARR